eukprot:7609511-Karenia_brevis.AAC.1
MGFQFEGRSLVNHAIWADNLYLFASSRLQLKSMFDMITAAIYQHDLRWKSAELQFIAGTNVDGTADVDVDTPEGPMKLKFVEVMRVLGVMLDRRGGPGA